MKRIIALLLVVGFAVPVMATPKTAGDIWSVGDYGRDNPGEVKIRAASDGTLVLDSSTTINGDITLGPDAQILGADRGVDTAHEVFIDLDLSTYSVVNTMHLSSAAFISGGSGGGTTYWYRSTGIASGLTQPKYPRKLVLKIVQDGGHYSTHTITGTWTIYGMDQFGYDRTDAISVSTMNYTVTSNYAFGFVSTMTLATTQFNVGVKTTANVNVGVGKAVGLCGDIQASGDIIKVCEDRVSYDVDWSTVTVDTTYDTIEFWNAPNGSKDWDVWYRRGLK